jgi:hypothetical protein
VATGTRLSSLGLRMDDDVIRSCTATSLQLGYHFASLITASIVEAGHVDELQQLMS